MEAIMVMDMGMVENRVGVKEEEADGSGYGVMGRRES